MRYHGNNICPNERGGWTAGKHDAFADTVWWQLRKKYVFVNAYYKLFTAHSDWNHFYSAPLTMCNSHINLHHVHKVSSVTLPCHSLHSVSALAASGDNDTKPLHIHWCILYLPTPAV